MSVLDCEYPERSSRKGLSRVLDQPTPFVFRCEQALAGFYARYQETDDFFRSQGLMSELSDETYSWGDFCREQGQDPVLLLGEFAAYAQEKLIHEEQDWTDATLDELVGHLITEHHNCAHVLLDRMEYVSQALAFRFKTPSERFDRLRSSQQHLSRCWRERMQKEEQEIFPLCLQIECAEAFSQDETLDKLLNDLHALAQEAQESDLSVDRLEDALAALAPDIPSDHQHLIHAFQRHMRDFAAYTHRHLTKEHDILMPAVLFTHDIRRSNSESRRFSNTE